MALTDTGIRKAKAKVEAYRLSDGGGSYISGLPLLGASSGAGSTAMKAEKSSCRLAGILTCRYR